MSKPHRIRIALFASLAAAGLVLLAGCGDDDSGSAGSADATTTAEDTAATTTASGGDATAPDKQGGGEDPGPVVPPETVIEEFLVSGDSSEVCRNEISPELLESTYGDLSGCRSGRPAASLADSVTVKDLEVDGDSATATAVPKGGSSDGAKVTFELELDGDRWVITQVEADIPVGP